MTRIELLPYCIRINGHAGDKVVCAMLTSQTVGIIKNLTENYFVEGLDFKLEPGFFYLNIRNLPIEAAILVNGFGYCLAGLASSYPNNIQLIQNALPAQPCVNKS